MSKLEQLVSITHDFKQMPTESRQVVSGTNHFKGNIIKTVSRLVSLPNSNSVQPVTPQRGIKLSALGSALDINGIGNNRPKGAKAYQYGSIVV